MLIHLNKNNIHIVFYFYCNMWDRVPTLEKTYFSPKSLSKVRSDKNKCRFRIL
jgi:hypothetical protein